jgi:hypothetical protein
MKISVKNKVYHQKIPVIPVLEPKGESGMEFYAKNQKKFSARYSRGGQDPSEK